MTRSDGYITTNEAAHELGVTRQRILQLIQDGRLKAEKFANVYMIRQADLLDIEAKPMGRPPNKPSPAPEKTATGAAKVGNGRSTGKKKGGKR
jgi:excisionase family DNA binding protein